MKIGIYGLGVVGGALARYLEHEGHDVLRRDPKFSHDDDFSDVDAIFVCVPIPTKGYRQDLSIVNSILIKYRNTAVPIFLRSTALPGTADKLAEQYKCNVISCPEFLTERRADRDMEELPILVGHKGFAIAQGLFFGANRVRAMTNKECEMAKYVHNCFGAYKVTFFNAMYRLCRQHGCDYQNVLRGTLSSGHINAPHTQVPGPDGKLGFGGTCFPKDMEAMIGMMEGDPFGQILNQIYCLNRLYRGLKQSEEFKGLDL